MIKHEVLLKEDLQDFRRYTGATKLIPSRREEAMERIPFVDFFCGAGGLSAGFEMAGFRSCYANDNDPYACETYAKNHPDSIVVHGNVEDLTGRAILERTGLKQIPLVIGGPNCQGVSLRGKRDPKDPKNLMFSHFKRLISELRPDWFVMENVPGLLHRHNRDLAKSIFEAFDQIGYRCGADVLLAADYGVPQLRYRLVLIGTRTKRPVFFPRPTHQGNVTTKSCRLLFPRDVEEQRKPCWVTVQEAIGDLPRLANGGGSLEADYQKIDRETLSPFQKWCIGQSRALHNHLCHLTSESNVELIKHIPPGGNWRNIPAKKRPARFKLVALKDHTTTYGRLAWDRPSRTITTYFNNISSGAFTHPEQHRGISVREGARLQGFPDDFSFVGPLARQYRQVGNAVPPLLASHVADAVMEMMIGLTFDETVHMRPNVTLDTVEQDLAFERPLQGMRFNLDEHLVRA